MYSFDLCKTLALNGLLHSFSLSHFLTTCFSMDIVTSSNFDHQSLHVVFTSVHTRNLQLLCLLYVSMTTAGIIHPSSTVLGYTMDVTVSAPSPLLGGKGREPFRQPYLNPTYLLDKSCFQNSQTASLTHTTTTSLE